MYHKYRKEELKPDLILAFSLLVMISSFLTMLLLDCINKPDQVEVKTISSWSSNWFGDSFETSEKDLMNSYDERTGKTMDKQYYCSLDYSEDKLSSEDFAEYVDENYQKPCIEKIKSELPQYCENEYSPQCLVGKSLVSRCNRYNEIAIQVTNSFTGYSPVMVLLPEYEQGGLLLERGGLPFPFGISYKNGTFLKNKYFQFALPSERYINPEEKRYKRITKELIEYTQEQPTVSYCVSKSDIQKYNQAVSDFIKLAREENKIRSRKEYESLRLEEIKEKNIENNIKNVGLVAAQNQLKQDMSTSKIEKMTAEFNKKYQKWRKENLTLLERSFGSSF